MIRLNEILESVKIVRQCAERMPAGDYRIQDRKVTPPPRARIDESMEALDPPFQALHRGLPGPARARPTSRSNRPAARSVATFVSDGDGKPVRLHIRGPSLYNLQSLDPMVAKGALVADAVAIVSSVDPIMGEADR